MIGGVERDIRAGNVGAVPVSAVARRRFHELLPGQPAAAAVDLLEDVRRRRGAEGGQAAGHGQVVGVAAVSDRGVVGEQQSLADQLVQVRRLAVADDVGVRLVLFHDHHELAGLRDRNRLDRPGQAGRQQQAAHDQNQFAHDNPSFGDRALPRQSCPSRHRRNSLIWRRFGCAPPAAAAPQWPDPPADAPRCE